jgi:HTH-type transcriptional repressor of NAD biosynthesis genes
MAAAISDMTQWDLVLFLEPDVAFVQDGTRNETIAAEREKYSQQIKQALSEHNVSYHCLSGDYLERFEKAKALIGELGITSRF